MMLSGDSRCPFCRAALGAPEAELIASKPCPRCGAELWAVVTPDGPVFYLRQPGQTQVSFLAGLAAPLYGMSVNDMEEILRRADSLDLVEMVMEIEDKLRPNRR